MAITLQALQADGTWSVRNAFVTDNKMLERGLIRVDELEAKARKLMAQWQATCQDGRQLRIHNSANGPKPQAARNSHVAEPLRDVLNSWTPLVPTDPTKPHIHAAGTLVGKHIDACAICGQDLRCDIHDSKHRVSA